jgi:hypothetical protein
MNENTNNPAGWARSLVRGADRAALATAMTDNAQPYPSLVMIATAPDASPLLMISELADHTKNLAANNSAGLLIDGTQGLENPLTGARVSLLGTFAKCTEEDLKRRFLAHHPDAEIYAGFADFALYRLTVERAHLVAGFGDIHWMAGEDYLFDTEAAAELCAAETDIVDHMNSDHADALALCATQLLGQDDAAWRMTGIDPEGCGLRAGGRLARLQFCQPVLTAEDARSALIELVAKARKSAEKD